MCIGVLGVQKKMPAAQKLELQVEVSLWVPGVEHGSSERSTSSLNQEPGVLNLCVIRLPFHQIFIILYSSKIIVMK